MFHSFALYTEQLLLEKGVSDTFLGIRIIRKCASHFHFTLIAIFVLLLLGQALSAFVFDSN